DRDAERFSERSRAPRFRRNQRAKVVDPKERRQRDVARERAARILFRETEGRKQARDSLGAVRSKMIGFAARHLGGLAEELDLDSPVCDANANVHVGWLLRTIARQ